MARSFLTAVNFNKNELQNPQIHNVPGTTGPPAPVKGQLYFDSTGNVLYFYDGTLWQSTKAGAGFPGYGSVPAETSFGIARADGVATTVARSDHTHGSPTHDAAAHSTIPLSALAAPTADINMNSYTLLNLPTPNTGSMPATKTYVDNLVSGLSWKAAARVATTTNGTLSTAFANGQTVDGVVLATGDRILIKNQTTQTENGIYTVNASGAPTRATDNDTMAEMNAAAVFVMTGTTNLDTAWTQTNDNPVIGSTPIVWTQFAGTGMVTAGAGLTQNGNIIDVAAANGSIVLSANDVQVGYAGTGGNFGSAVTAARSDHTHSQMARVVFGGVSAATSSVINHNLNSRNVAVNVYRTATPWDTVETDVERTDANNVTVRFATAPAANEYTVVVVG